MTNLYDWRSSRRPRRTQAVEQQAAEAALAALQQASATSAPASRVSPRQAVPQEEQPGGAGGFLGNLFKGAFDVINKPFEWAGSLGGEIGDVIRPLVGRKPLTPKEKLELLQNTDTPPEFALKSLGELRRVGLPLLSYTAETPYIGADKRDKLREEREASTLFGGIIPIATDPDRLERALREHTSFPPGVMGALEILHDPLFLIMAPAAGVRSGITLAERKAAAVEAQKAAKELIAKHSDNIYAPKTIPTEAELFRQGVNPGWAQQTAQTLSDWTVLGKHPLRPFVQHINPSADLRDPLNKALVGYNRMLDWGDSSFYPVLEKAQYIAKDAFQYNSKKEILNARRIPGSTAPANPRLEQFMQLRAEYIPTPAQAEAFKLFDEVKSFILLSEQAAGVPRRLLTLRPGEEYFPRLVTSINGAKVKGGLRNAIGAKQFNERARFHEYLEDGLARGVDYLGDFTSAVELYYKAGLHNIADHRLRDGLLQLGGRTGRASQATTIAKKGAVKAELASRSMVKILNLARDGKPIPMKLVHQVEAVQSGTGIRQAVIAYRGGRPTGLGPLERRLRQIDLKLSESQGRKPLEDLFVGREARSRLLAEREKVVRDIADAQQPFLGLTAETGRGARVVRKRLAQERMSQMRLEAFERLDVDLRHLSKTRIQFNKELSTSKRPAPGEAAITQPAFNGHVFPLDMAKKVNDFLGQEVGRITHGLRTVSSTSVTLGTTIDIGWPFIQGLVLLGTKPLTWAKMWAVSVKSLKDKEFMGKFYSIEDGAHFLSSQRAARNGVLFEGMASSEMVKEAANIGAMLQGGRAGIVGAPGRFVGAGFERFGAGFSNAGNVARTLLWESLEPMAARRGAEALKELAAWVNKATGTVSSRSLGLSKNQMAIETLTLFAPRFTRATLGLLADALQGGLRGELARASLAKMATSGLIMYTLIAEMLGQEPCLDPRPAHLGGCGGKFFSLNILGQNVGVGGSILAITKTLAHASAAAAEDPLAFVRLGTKENPFPDQPFVRFMRGRLSPVAGATWDTVTGKNFIGESTDFFDSPLQWSKEVIASRAMPFWLESALFDSPRPGLGWGGEFAGMRTFPISFWDRRNDLRNKHANEKHGVDYDELTIYEQSRIDNEVPEIEEATLLARELQMERADDLDLLLHDRTTEIIEITELRDEALEKVQSEFEDTDVSPRLLKNKIDEALRNYRRDWERIEINPKYEEVRSYFETLSEDKRVAFGDFAFDEYIALVLGDPSIEDEYGNYNYDLRRQIEDEFKNKWGQKIYDYVRARITGGRTEYPPFALALLEGRERPEWRTYWEVDKEVFKRLDHPELVSQYRLYRRANPLVKAEIAEAFPIFKQVEATIGRARQIMRENNRELDAFLYRFGYTTTVRHKDNEDREQEILNFG